MCMRDTPIDDLMDPEGSLAELDVQPDSDADMNERTLFPARLTHASRTVRQEVLMLENQKVEANSIAQEIQRVLFLTQTMEFETLQII